MKPTWAPESSMYGLRNITEREACVIGFVSQGFKNHEIASAMGVSEHVVKNYLKVVYDKLGFYNRVELALWHVARTQALESNTLEMK